MRLSLLVFLFVVGLADVLHEAGREADDNGVDLGHDAKKWWVAEDKDGTQHFDAEALCSRNFRISARDGSPVNELLEHGFDPLTGQLKGKTRDITDDSWLKSNPVYVVEMEPIWNSIKQSDHEKLRELSPELFEKRMQYLKEALMKLCKTKVASYAADSRYKVEIV